MSRFSRVLSVLIVMVTAGTVLAHVRLRHPTSLANLFWSSPTNVSIVINRTGSDNISDGSHITAVRNAIDEWNRASGTTLQLVENTSEAAMNRTDWEANDIHLVWWDEDNSSGFFGGNEAVAITPIFFFSNGVIADADVLFNGQDFQFTTNDEIGSFDVQNVAAHELGHLIGFDHTGWAGATMFPFVETTVDLQRSLSEDERTGLRDAYPSALYASITGNVLRQSDSTGVIGAHVVARDSAGRTAASTLSETAGGFVLRGLLPDTYEIYATPFEGVVDEGNLGDGHPIEDDFEATVHSLAAVVTAGTNTDIGDLIVTPDVGIMLGNNLTAFPLSATSGASTNFSIRGAGLELGSSLTASDPSITLMNVNFGVSQVTFTCDVPGGAQPGHFDLTATTPGGDTSILTAPIEIVPPAPTVAMASPPAGSNMGGVALTLTGTGFRSGARVVLGDSIYVDGEPGGATVVDSTTITLTTAASVAGNLDVVVIDESGVEGRLDAGYQSLGVPILDTAFPSAGSSAGGTRVRLTGSDFATDAVVRINGIAQPGVVWLDSTLLEFTTAPAAAGGPFDIEVVNPGPAATMLSGEFSYVALPDPTIASFSPDVASFGILVTVSGSNFTGDTRIVFGADEETGLGGVLGDNHNLVDASTLEVTVPAANAGAQSLMVTNNMTGQATLATASFTVLSRGGGGGGCFVREVRPGPFDLRSILTGGGWALLVLAILLLRARRQGVKRTAAA